MNILVTGSNGQLGSELKFVSEQYNNFNYIFTDLEDLDICNRDKIEEFVLNYKIDCIINCAAYTNVYKAQIEPMLCDIINHIAPINLANIANKYDIWLIHISTDYVFDGLKNIPYTEEDYTNPQSVYGQTKLRGENEILKINKKTLIIRTSWLYSVFGNNFVKNILKTSNTKDKIDVVYDQIGTPTNARDLANAINIMINQGLKNGIYHYSNEGVCSWYDFAKSIIDLTEKKCEVIPIKTKDLQNNTIDRPNYSVLDKSKIKQTYSLKIKHWYESLKDVIYNISI